MINLFFDCEFSHLQLPLDREPASLISIGVVALDGKKFYAENADAQLDLCSDFTRETVLPLLEAGDVLMPYGMIAEELREWIEDIEGEAAMWTDAPAYDWPHVQHMFDVHGWPGNLRRTAKPLMFSDALQQIRFKAAVADAFTSFEPKLRMHHALDDSIANRHGFMRATQRKY